MLSSAWTWIAWNYTFIGETKQTLAKQIYQHRRPSRGCGETRKILTRCQNCIMHQKNMKITVWEIFFLKMVVYISESCPYMELSSFPVFKNAYFYLISQEKVLFAAGTHFTSAI